MHRIKQEPILLESASQAKSVRCLSSHVHQDNFDRADIRQMSLGRSGKAPADYDETRTVSSIGFQGEETKLTMYVDQVTSLATPVVHGVKSTKIDFDGQLESYSGVAETEQSLDKVDNTNTYHANKAQSRIVNIHHRNNLKVSLTSNHVKELSVTTADALKRQGNPNGIKASRVNLYKKQQAAAQ